MGIYVVQSYYCICHLSSVSQKVIFPEDFLYSKMFALAMRSYVMVCFM